MAKTLGKDYRLFVKAADAETFAAPSGQGNLVINRGNERVDTSTKETGNYGTSQPGQKSLTVTQAILPDLPDVQFSRMKTLDAAGEATIYQIRRKPFADEDAVFECEMYTGQSNTDANRTEALGTSFELTAAAAPTKDDI